MTHAITAEVVVDQNKKKDLLEYYRVFMKDEDTKPQVYESLNKFKQSTFYKELTQEEQERYKESFKEYEDKGENVIFLVFKNKEQVIDFINQAETNGLMTKEQAEQSRSNFATTQEEPSRGPRM